MSGVAVHLHRTQSTLMQRGEAEIAFTGLGPYDVFARYRRYIGTVIFNQAQPPFKPSDSPHYVYAEGFTVFPRGCVDVEKGCGVY